MAEKCKITLATDIAKTDLKTFDSSSPGYHKCKFMPDIAIPIWEC